LGEYRYTTALKKLKNFSLHIKKMQPIRKNGNYEGGRRGTLDIVAEILEEAKTGSGKTRIMVRANLSYSQLQRYLTGLVRAGLLATEKNKRDFVLYKTTDRGKVFLSSYSEIQQFLIPES
jgi:predicted transcriptional regulator